MLSIIIPQYKETFEFMRPLFESLDGQRLIDFSQVEVIVVNDCGDPLKMEQFEVFEHIRPHLISTAKNSGPSVARQRGIDFAHGEFIMPIDADDCLNGQHALFRIMSAIYEKPETDFSRAVYRRARDRGNVGFASAQPGYNILPWKDISQSIFNGKERALSPKT